MLNHRFTQFVLSLLLLLAGGACGMPAPITTSAVPSLVGLPAPDQLNRGGTPARVSCADQLRTGIEYENDLPNQHMQRSAPATAVFHPNWGDAPGARTFADVACAIYAFEVPLNQPHATVAMQWSTAPDADTLWIGLADFNANLWRWFPAEADKPLDIPGLQGYLGKGVELYVAIVVLGVGVTPALEQVELVDSALELNMQYTDLQLPLMGGCGTSGLCLVDGAPACAAVIEDEGFFGLRFAHASSPDGSSWNAPRDMGDCFQCIPGLGMADGNPALAFVMDLKGFVYRRADNAQGTDWGAYIWVDTGNAGWMREIVLAQVADFPAAAYSSDGAAAGTNRMNFIRAEDAQGAAWPADAVTLDTNAGNEVYYKPCIKLIGGVPVVAYAHYNYDDSTQGVRIAVAQDATGAVWNAPVQVWSAPIDNSVLRKLCLLDLSGKPGLAWYIEDFAMPEDSRDYFCAAEDAAGATWGPTSTLFSTDRGFDNILFSAYCTVDTGAASYLVAQGVMLTAEGSERAEVYLLPISTEGLVDFNGAKAHLHAQFTPAGKGASQAAFKHASCFDSWDDLYSLASYDSVSREFTFQVLGSGMLSGASNASVAYSTIELKAIVLTWE